MRRNSHFFNILLKNFNKRLGIGIFLSNKEVKEEYFMRSIMVEPERLEAAASRIEEANRDYDRTYQAIYIQVDKMSSSWQGKDNTAFTNQIKAFEDDLRQISIIMRQYADFLRNSARAYRETQDEIYARAVRLRSA